MALTSTSSTQKSFKYDVFLSFRGEDTRDNFVSHLYKALVQRGIQTYKDDKKIEKGKTIDKQLIKSIEDSRFFIIVFSKDYASSRWCLDELVKIMECQKTSDERIAYPVFYHVEPREIRNQSGAVGEAFKKHENEEAATKWSDALNEAGKLAGSELKGDESILIEEIVDVIFKKKCLSSSSVDGNLVGMETRIDVVLSSLELDADDFRMMGIWGMGGGGKTTLAGAVFDRIFIQFDGKVFVENVREVSNSSFYGLKELQQQILRSVLSDENIAVRSVHEGKNMMKDFLCGRKVLVVLDDVDDREQLEALAGSPDWFKSGSRVIITTRDKQVLLSHRVKFINNVSLLSRAEAISLFNKYAFNRDIPVVGYEELLEEVVQYADGLPLTIKVLGSLLCGQNVPQWKDTLARLKKIPLKATMEKLELSYDGLEDDQKEIFLDVACLLKGWRKDKAVIALKSCGFFAEVGLRVLEQRSLINISVRGELGMHDHIEEMGKNIVRRLHLDNPEKHSRLWIREEIVDILANESGTQAATKCITLDARGLNCEILMNGLTNMKELRFLHVVADGLNCGEVDPYLPNGLRFLRWEWYPFSSLPKTFQAKNLVGLDMYNSGMVQLLEDGEEKACLNLRFLKFTWSNLRTLDLSVAPNLETLILENCDNLVEVHFQVTPYLKELRIFRCYKLEKLHMPAESPELISLNLEESKLRTLHLGKTPNLETLNLYKCTDMVELCMPAESPKLRSLNLEKSKLMTLHLGKTPNLETLILRYCTDMDELRMPTECPKLVTLKLCEVKFRTKLQTLHLRITPNLKTVRLDWCTGLVELRIPDESPKLEELSLSCCDMVELHMPAEYPKLVDLHLHNLRKLRTLHLGITPNLEKLLLGHCPDMVELCMLAECPKLVDLNLYCLELTTHQILQILAKCPNLVNLELCNLELTALHLGTTPNLEKLSLSGCPHVVELHITECPKLVDLHLNLWKLRTLHLGITPNLEKLVLGHCPDIVELCMLAECPKLVDLDLYCLELTTHQILQILAKCPNLVNLELRNLELTALHLGTTPNLEKLSLSSCPHVVELHITECPKLVTLRLSNCGRFKSFEFDKELDSPEVVSLSELHLIADDTDVADDADDSPEGVSLSELHLIADDTDDSPEGVSLSELHLIAVKRGALGNTWPEFQFSCYYKEDRASSLGNLERLISLGFGACINFDSFSDIICGLQCLRKLTLEGGIPEAPKNLDQLDCLEELSLRSTDIKNLPDSLCMLKHLKSLEIKSCCLLEKLPEDIGRLQCLEKLIVKKCIFLRDIPNSICEMHRLESLDLTGCIRIEELPEVIGCLEYLKELNITRTGITCLPKSIYQLKGLRIIDDDDDDDDVKDVDRGCGDDDYDYDYDAADDDDYDYAAAAAADDDDDYDDAAAAAAADDDDDDDDGGGDDNDDDDGDDGDDDDGGGSGDGDDDDGDNGDDDDDGDDGDNVDDDARMLTGMLMI